MGTTKLKSIESTARRIIKRVQSGDYDQELIEHMIGSIVKNRENIINNLKTISIT